MDIDLRCRCALMLLLAGITLTGCRSQPQPPISAAELPPTFDAPSVEQPMPAGWTDGLGNAHVEALINQAVARNYGLAQQAQAVEIARQTAIASGAPRWPSLNLSADGQRRDADTTQPIINSTSLVASVAFELDIWGRLSDSQRQAQLTLRPRCWATSVPSAH